MEFPKSYEVRLPRNITFGLGAVEKIGERVQEYGAKRALIVTDRALAQSMVEIFRKAY